MIRRLVIRCTTQTPVKRRRRPRRKRGAGRHRGGQQQERQRQRRRIDDQDNADRHAAPAAAHPALRAVAAKVAIAVAGRLAPDHQGHALPHRQIAPTADVDDALSPFLVTDDVPAVRRAPVEVRQTTDDAIFPTASFATEFRQDFPHIVELLLLAAHYHRDFGDAHENVLSAPAPAAPKE